VSKKKKERKKGQFLLLFEGKEGKRNHSRNQRGLQESRMEKGRGGEKRVQRIAFLFGRKEEKNNPANRSHPRGKKRITPMFFHTGEKERGKKERSPTPSIGKKKSPALPLELKKRVCSKGEKRRGELISTSEREHPVPTLIALCEKEGVRGPFAEKRGEDHHLNQKWPRTRRAKGGGKLQRVYRRKEGGGSQHHTCSWY